MSCDSASEHCSRFNNDTDDADDAILPTLAAWLLDCCDSGPNIKNDFARGCHSELKLQSWRIIATPRSPKECPLSYMLTSATRTAHCGHLLGSLALHHMRRGYRKKVLPKGHNAPNAPNAPNTLSQCHTHSGHYGSRLRWSPSLLTRFNLRSAFGCFADRRRQPRSIAPGSEYFFGSRDDARLPWASTSRGSPRP